MSKKRGKKTENTKNIKLIDERNFAVIKCSVSKGPMGNYFEIT